MKTINFQKLPHIGIRSLIPYKPGKSIESLAQEKGLTEIIKMASNENPLGCSPLALQALQQIPSKTVSCYPSPLNHPLLPQLAAKQALSPNQIFLSNGSDYLCSVLLSCFALHRDKHIVVHDYAFSTYAIQAQSLKIPCHSVPVCHWQVDIDALIKACSKKTALLFLANPNNPTGLMIAPEQVKYLLERIPETTLLVLDEAYYEFVADRYACNTVSWLKAHPNLVIMRTFSKIYGLAGLRLGYAMADAALVDILRRFQLPFMINQAALNAASAALEDEAFIELSLKTNTEGMRQLILGLQALNIAYLPSACNFLSLDCQEDGLALYHFLLDRGIIVRPLHAYGMDNYLRVTVGTAAQNRRFLMALNEYKAY